MVKLFQTPSRGADETAASGLPKVMLFWPSQTFSRPARVEEMEVWLYEGKFGVREWSLFWACLLLKVCIQLTSCLRLWRGEVQRKIHSKGQLEGNKINLVKDQIAVNHADKMGKKKELPAKTLLNAASTLVDSKADVSRNKRPFFSGQYK